jgi:hypothetical protein
MAGAAALALAMLASTSCGDAVRQGRASSYLVVDQLTAASGAKPSLFSNVLESDVVTLVKATVGTQTVLVPTVFEDLGQVQLHIAMKDPGGTVPSNPSTVNQITLDRYEVTFVRSDGRATPGVDVPAAFFGAITGTVTATPTAFTFVLVRAQAKLEAPLMAMRNGGGNVVLSTIAQVTVYGHDQAGNTVSLTGSMSVNFADWGDPG